MLLSLKGGTCQHLDYEHMANSHLCLWALIDTCLHAQTFRRIAVFGSVAERQAQLPPHLAKRNWTEKVSTSWQRYSALSSVSPHRQENKENQRQQHDGTFVKECCSMWRVEFVNIWTMSIWPIHIFVTKRRLILACMHKPFGELRYLAGSQRGRRSWPRIWLSAIESKRYQHLGKGTQPFLLPVPAKQIQKRIKDNSMTGLLWKNVAQFQGWDLSTSGLWWAYGQFTSLSLSADWYLPACTNLSENWGIWQGRSEAGAVGPAFG